MNKIIIYNCFNYLLLGFFLSVSCVYAQQATLQIGHSNRVEDLKFSPNQQLLASAGKDGTIKLWHTQTGKLLRTLQDFQKNHLNLWAFSPDSKYLLVVRENVVKTDDNKEHQGKKEGYEISVWDLATGKPVQTWVFKGGHPDLIRERYLLLNAYTKVEVYDFLNQKITHTLLPKGDKFLIQGSLYTALGNHNQSLFIQNISENPPIILATNFSENTHIDTLLLNKVQYLNQNLMLIDYKWLRYYEDDKSVSQSKNSYLSKFLDEGIIQSRFFQVIDIKNRKIIYQQKYHDNYAQGEKTTSYNKILTGLQVDTLAGFEQSRLVDENHLLLDYHMADYDLRFDDYVIRDKKQFFQLINLKTQKIIRQEKVYQNSKIKINEYLPYYLKMDLDKRNIKLIHLITGKEIHLEKIEAVEKAMGDAYYDRRSCFFQHKYVIGYPKSNENSNKSSAYIWETESGKLIMEIPEIKPDINGYPPDIRLSEMESGFITFLQHDTVSVYKLKNKELQLKFKHTLYERLESSTDGNIMITEHKIINIKEKTIKDISLNGRGTIFSSDKQPRYFAGAYGNKIQLVDLQSFQSKILENSFYGIKSVKFSPEQASFAFTIENLLKVYNFSTGLEESILMDSAYQNNYSLFWAGNEIWVNKGSSLKCWNIDTKKLSSSLISESMTSCFTLNLDKQLLIEGGLDGKIRVWNILNQKTIQIFASNLSYINALTLSKDEQSLAGGGADSIVVVYDFKAGKEFRKLPKQDGIINALAFHPQQTLLASAGTGSTIYLWDIVKGELWHSFKIQQGGVEVLLFTPDGKYLLSAGRDNNIQIWSLEQKQLLHTLSGHQGWVADLSISSDGRYLLSAGLDGQLRIWDIEQGKEVLTLLTFLDDNNFVMMTPDGRFDGTPAGMDKLIHFVAGTEIIELEQLKERYYEPGLWVKLMGTSDEPLREIKGLDQIRLYPEIELNLDKKKNLLNIKLTERSGGIGKVNFYINGMEMQNSEQGNDFNPQRKTEFNIPLKNYQKYLGNGENTLSIKAYHDEGWLHSRFAEVTYNPEELKGDTLGSLDLDFDPADYTSKKVPDFYALVIGTSDYAGTPATIKDLEYPDKDAEEIAQALDLAARRLFIDEDNEKQNKVHIQLLNTSSTLKDFKNTASLKAGASPGKAAIQQAFKSLNQIAKEDVLLVYLSGHGTNYKKDGEQDGQFYYLTRDMAGFNLSDQSIRENYAISTEELIQWLNDIPAQKKVLVMDACASGKAVDRWDELLAQKDVPSSQKRILELMKDRTGLFMISGSTSDAVSYEASPYGQGLLTYSLLLGMSGPALQNSEYVDVLQWFNFAANKVPDLAKEFGVSQQPQIASPYKATSFQVGKILNEDKAKIELSQPKPYFLRCAFQNEESFADELELSERLNSELREITAKGKNAQVIYLDLAQHPNAYQIRGRYSIHETQVKAQCRVFKGKEQIGTLIEVEGLSNDPDTIIEDILSAAIKQLKH